MEKRYHHDLSLQALRLGINLFTPALCGIVLVEIGLQVLWNYFSHSDYKNELLACALVGCLLYATLLGIIGKNSRSSTVVSGIFYLLAGGLSFLIQGFHIVLLGIDIALNDWATLLIVVGLLFIYCGCLPKRH